MKYTKAKLNQMVNILRENAEVYFDNLSEQLKDPKQVSKYLEGCLSNETSKEVFGCLFLNTKNRLIKFEILFEGTIDQSTVFPREIVKKAFEYDSSAVILFHNHPSGICKPSKSDIELTKAIQTIFENLNIKLIDHVIIGKPGKFCSMVTNGLIKQGERNGKF